ncbi:hypothetical protein ACFS5N_13835 [Mucilaginibacter ximonensis]|uniref:Uncharacterized protein n=1 Tax=Mucilaginibacter ximonensis TaxID=538021 RepID=A0ABW5YE69_9SPHI
MPSVFNCKFFCAVLPALFLAAFANGQKLPNIQKTALRAPANIKVDGKVNEWPAGLQAYNHAIQASYTIANDDNKLYLIVSSNRKEIINKMINGGVSLVVNKVRKSMVGGVSVMYPVFAPDNSPVINLNVLYDTKADAPNANRKIDSLIKVNNALLNDKAKFIRLSGVQGDIDTLISVYNKDGVKAYSAFDGNRNYTLEISVDLKVLGLSINNKTPFNYAIRFNELKLDYVPGVDITRNTEGVITQMKVTDVKLANSYMSVLNTTDCWGTYTLAK